MASGQNEEFSVKAGQIVGQAQVSGLVQFPHYLCLFKIVLTCVIISEKIRLRVLLLKKKYKIGVLMLVSSG